MKPIDKAFTYLGLKEIPGAKHNPQILEFFKAIGHKWVQDDETAWCAAFANYCCKETVGKHTGKLNARSFLTFGEEVQNPEIGDIVVFWRGSPDSWKGHVAFYVHSDDDYIYVLGGNQGNAVRVSMYAKDRLLSYRRV